MFKDWGKDIDLFEYVIKDDVQKMIDVVMKKYNCNVLLISIGLGIIVLVGYVDGMLRILERI